MPVSLQKGENVSLSLADPNLRAIVVGLGWNARETEGASFDLDASVFMLNGTGKVRRDEDFIFYNNLTSMCSSVEHTGDEKSGGSGGDDESIKVYLDTVPESVVKIAVTVTIHDANGRKQNFGQVEGAYIRIENMDTGIEIVRFDLAEDYGSETSMVFGEVYRNGSEWKFRAVGQGFAGGLESLCRKYGVSLA